MRLHFLSFLFAFIFLTPQLGHSFGMRRMAKAKKSVGTINLTIASNTLNYNIFTAAGSPTSAQNVTVTVNAGVMVGSSSTAVAAMVTGSFPAGSTIVIVNNGSIIGAGGAGGDGGTASRSSTVTTNNGHVGGDGGPAISLQYPVTITNNGNIWGGGGGGGGGSGHAPEGLGGGGGGA